MRRATRRACRLMRTQAIGFVSPKRGRADVALAQVARALIAAGGQSPESRVFFVLYTVDVVFVV